MGLACLLSVGCADLSYYLHSVKGQLSMVQKTVDIDDLLAEESTDPKLVEQLQLVSRIRAFAFDQLQLPRSDSYTRYADLDRNHVLKNLYAADEFSITLQQWCYPIVGCAGYRGYFDDAMLEAFKADLLKQSKDVYVSNIPAYSTLGWFDDPVLNTFVYWPEPRLAGLIFHELAHQRLYIDGDTGFNESFAMAVQLSGTEKWLQQSGQAQQMKQYQQRFSNRQQVTQLIEQTRLALNELYQSELDDSQKRVQKQQVFEQLRQSYQSLSAGFEVSDGFSYWFQGELNNAKLASVSTYYADVAAFRQLLRSVNDDYQEFYRQVAKAAALAPVQRAEQLKQWLTP
ncbi:MAG: aminopeptidase [Gammaproteobacteria bacterium]|nr:aminopeptidase [Gammaproteobacteria bacterium]